MRALAPALLSLALATCARPPPQAPPRDATTPRFPPFPARARGGPSPEFSRIWFSGDAELSGYRGVVPRYGELRAAEVALVYVTEPMDRRTWIKDDAARGDDRVGVLKLNASLRFTTGVYPYSVLTSVFSPYGDWGRERLSPVKITLTAQEWCGHVFHAVWPGDDRFVSELRSYFAQEGETRGETRTAPGALYEDALMIQLRELDGPFAGGGDWRGEIVPSLWRTRRAHRAGGPVAATITRAREGDRHRFTLRYGDFERVYEVEAGGARRVLAWRSSDGEDLRVAGTARMPYWQLNREADLPRRAELGLDVPPRAPASDGGSAGF